MIDQETIEQQKELIILNLSSWSSKRLPLQTWLADELNAIYDAPRKATRAWVEGDMLLLLLDGLFI